MYSFFATLSRMKYIERWALMRSSRPENLSEHSLETAMIAHALCTIGNVRLGKKLNAEKAALIGLFHDASEIITGDMPTPVKYYSEEIRDAYKAVESAAQDRLLDRLPQDLRGRYRDIFEMSEELSGEDAENERYMRALVKAADKISALIKCVEEENAGNTEFRTAKRTVEAAVEELAAGYPEAEIFMEEFFPAYGRTLDELENGI